MVRLIGREEAFVESLGDKLRTTRESKGYTYSHVGRETNIAIRYIEALENEDFSKFPGEPYILGFLRNYGEYLGLDVNELISLYRTLRIQEQPVPVEQLLKPQRQFPKPLLIILICLAVAAGIGGIIFAVSRRPAGPKPETMTRNPVQYTLDSNSLEKRFYVNDSVLVPFDNNKFIISLAGITDAVSINSPVGNFTLELSQEKDIDLDGDGIPELTIAIADLIKNDPSKGSLIRFTLINGDTIPPVIPGDTIPAVPGTPAAISPEPAASVPANTPVLISSPAAYPFTLQATFKSFCMFRWESDRRTRDERYFHKSDVQNIQAQNGIRVWVSNASAVQLQVIAGGRTISVDLGGPGEVVVADIKWVRDDEGRFKLTVVRLD